MLWIVLKRTWESRSTRPAALINEMNVLKSGLKTWINLFSVSSCQDISSEEIWVGN